MDTRLRVIVEVSEKQYDVMEGKGTIDTIFIGRQLKKKVVRENK